MVTNFSHLKRWKRIYDSAVEMEEALLEATTVSKYKGAIGTSRDVLERIVKEMVKTAGIEDKSILQVMAQEGKAAQYPTNFGRILTLKRTGVLSPETINNLIFLNKKGNAARHADSELDDMNVEQIKVIAERVYSAVYRETYLFAHQYMPVLEAQKVKGINAFSEQKNQTALKVLAIVLWSLVGVIFLYAFLYPLI